MGRCRYSDPRPGQGARADGARAGWCWRGCLDIEFLRTGDDLFAAVPSDTAVARTFHEITPTKPAALVGALADVRKEVWRRSEVTTGRDPVILDIDASLVQIHSGNKEQAAPTYKGRYGFHPMFCFADATGETLSALLRPGNAGANTVVDHIAVLDAAIAQLPTDVAAGHRSGEDREALRREMIVRADSAGCTEDFLKACADRHVGFYVTARSNAQITAAIFDAIGVEEVWLGALGQDGEPKDGAHVAELTSWIDRAKLPDGTRLIARREPLHPGAQRSLFPSLDYHYWGFYTDLQAGDPRDFDVTARAHAHVEQHISRLKDSGLCRFPFTGFEDNATWLMVVGMAADLVRWFQLLCLQGAWRDARPKALRWSIFHTPGRLVHSARRRIVRVIEAWPTTDVRVDAYRCIELLT